MQKTSSFVSKNNAKSNSNTNNKSKLFSWIITFVIIGLLVLSGPVKALTFSLGSFTNNNVLIGGKTSAVATININSNERVLLNPVALHLNGIEACSFNAYNGAINSGCTGITIDVLDNSSASFGYGYGYAYGQPYGYGYNQGFNNGIFSYNITLDTNSFTAGDYTMQLFVNVTDSAVYSSDSQTLTIINDFTAPETGITLRNLDDSEYVPGTWTNQDVKINLSCSDDLSGCKNIWYNGWGLPLLYHLNSSQFDTLLSYSGYNYLDTNFYFASEDNFNNNETIQNKSVKIDKLAPTIALNYPADNALLNSRIVDFNWTPTDNSNNLLNCSLSVFPGVVDTANSGTNFVRQVSWANDIVNYSWSVNCTDLAGNTVQSETRRFTTDTSTPTVNITYPANNTFQDNTAFSMGFLPNDTYENDSKLSCTLMVDNNLWAGWANQFTPGNSVGLSTVFSEGVHNYYVRCSDDVNNTGYSETRKITMDTTKPTINFVSPTLNSGSYINATNIEAKVYSNDTHIMNLTTNLYDSNNTWVFAGNWISIASGTFYQNFTSLADGLYYINSTSCDIVNNCNSTETRNITVDTTAPQIALSLISQGQTELFIKVNITDVNPIIETCNVTRGIINGTNEIQNITESGLTCGTSYAYNITCKDIAGNSNSTLTSFSTQACPVQDSSGGGGCLTEWECSDWSVCSDNVQTRTCEKQRSGCYSPDPKPLEIQSCSTTTESDTENGRASNGITGAVIGAIGPIAFGTLVFILVVGAGLIIVRILRLRRLNRKTVGV